MTSIRLTCPACRNVTSVAATATVLGRGSDGVVSLALRCPGCRQISVRTLDANDADELRAACVPCTTVVRHTPAPAPPAAALLTRDDALDLHLALQRPTWFDELVSTGQDPAAPIHRVTDT